MLSRTGKFLLPVLDRIGEVLADGVATRPHV